MTRGDESMHYPLLGVYKVHGERQLIYIQDERSAQRFTSWWYTQDTRHFTSQAQVSSGVLSALNVMSLHTWTLLNLIWLFLYWTVSLGSIQLVLSLLFLSYSLYGDLDMFSFCIRENRHIVGCLSALKIITLPLYIVGVSTGPVAQRTITPEVRMLASQLRTKVPHPNTGNNSIGRNFRPTTPAYPSGPALGNNKPSFPPKPSGRPPRPTPDGNLPPGPPSTPGFPPRPMAPAPIPGMPFPMRPPPVQVGSQNAWNGNAGGGGRPFNPVARNPSFSKHTSSSPPIHHIQPPPPPSDPPPDNQPTISTGRRPPPIPRPPPATEKPKPRKPQVRALYE